MQKEGQVPSGKTNKKREKNIRHVYYGERWRSNNDD